MAIVKEMTRCPFCKEAVVQGASKCKHCLSELKPSPKGGRDFPAKLDTFRFGFAAGLMFMLLLALLTYLHFLANP